MALEFPISPVVGQEYQSGSSHTYTFDGLVWKIISDGVDTNLFATRGPNQFNGNQIINGSLFIEGVSENVWYDGEFNGDRTFDYQNASIFYLISLGGNGNWNVVNVPEDTDIAVTLTFVVVQGSPSYSGSYQINGSDVNVKWVNGVTPTYSSNKTDVIGLTAFRINSQWDVLGSVSSFS